MQNALVGQRKQVVTLVVGQGPLQDHLQVTAHEFSPLHVVLQTVDMHVGPWQLWSEVGGGQLYICRAGQAALLLTAFTGFPSSLSIEDLSDSAYIGESSSSRVLDVFD